jgi:hypothetical protein
MSFSSQTFLVRSLHAWRIALLCIAITHQRSHLALAILIVVPLNHILFNLTASLDPRAGESSTSRKFLRRVLGHTPSEPINDGIVIGLYLLATAVLVWMYGSLVALWADVRAFAATWEWWVMFGLLIALTILYRPVGRAIRELLRAAGLKDRGMWAALGLAVCLWIWCDAVFAECTRSWPLNVLTQLRRCVTVARRFLSRSPASRTLPTSAQSPFPPPATAISPRCRISLARSCPSRSSSPTACSASCLVESQGSLARRQGRRHLARENEPFHLAPAHCTCHTKL